jgi:hypothetical protein
MAAQFLELTVPLHAPIRQELKQPGAAAITSACSGPQVPGYGCHVRGEPFRLVLDFCLSETAPTQAKLRPLMSEVPPRRDILSSIASSLLFGGHQAGAHAGETGADHDDVDLVSHRAGSGVASTGVVTPVKPATPSGAGSVRKCLRVGSAMMSCSSKARTAVRG